MPRYFVWTIGCQMNKAESQRLAGCLESAGCQQANSISDADVVVLNTCVVRQSAEDRVLGTLGLLKGLKDGHPGIQILVTGCLVNSDNEELAGRFPHVDLLFKPGAYTDLVEWCKRKGCRLSQHRPSNARPSRSVRPGAQTTRRLPLPVPSCL
jgi:tRNA-2-methylthio-N6-dimethylallyladenosine synthase